MKPGRTHLGISQQPTLAAIVCVVDVHMVFRGDEPLGGRRRRGAGDDAWQVQQGAVAGLLVGCGGWWPAHRK